MNELIYPNLKVTLSIPHFICSEKIAGHLKSVFEGEYEVPLTYTGEQPVVLDLGANYGAFSIWASHRWPGCTVHAYEPNPEVFPVLERNLKIYGNIKAHSHGIGAPGERTLHIGQSNEGESSFHHGPRNGQTFIVRVEDPLTLPEAHIIKLDIEGCEAEVLEPLLAAGREFQAIMFEFHNRGLRTKLQELLEKDYLLTGAHLYSPDLGVLRYMNRKLL